MDGVISFYINGHLRESRKWSTPLTIGRSNDADFVLVHPLLSRNHCTLYEQDGELYLKDNNSLNGTTVLGADITAPVRLMFGDVFSVGSDLTFLVSALDSVDAVPAELTEYKTVSFTEEEIRSKSCYAAMVQSTQISIPK
ncbi:hypothetical protein FACS1894170_06210 [Planctomycetales bacterium]|nr:hypothetical protein FACS1894170_06210 [Planctomycetales bacterium]